MLTTASTLAVASGSTICFAIRTDTIARTLFSSDLGVD
jgi:hypothetical protein